jgi:hypothetical protein
MAFGMVILPFAPSLDSVVPWFHFESVVLLIENTSMLNRFLGYGVTAGVIEKINVWQTIAELRE